MALQNDCTNSSPLISTPFSLLFQILHPHTSSMETTKSSNTLHTFSYPQLQYTPPYLSLTTDSDNFQCNVPSKASSFDVPSAPKEHHSFQMSGSDSCSEEGGDATDVEEVSLDELLNDAKAKKKLEQLAAIVGVDTTEPAIVLTEVVRVLKLFNHYYTTT